jgi:hypothetical protein
MPNFDRKENYTSHLKIVRVEGRILFSKGFTCKTIFWKNSLKFIWWQGELQEMAWIPLLFGEG